jgi:hypothetical protein
MSVESGRRFVALAFRRCTSRLSSRPRCDMNPGKMQPPSLKGLDQWPNVAGDPKERPAPESEPERIPWEELVIYCQRQAYLSSLPASSEPPAAS